MLTCFTPDILAKLSPCGKRAARWAPISRARWRGRGRWRILPSGMVWLRVFRSRRMAVLFVLGFSSGLPLLLTGQTLQAWLTAEGVPLARIAAVSSVGLAYTFKAAWAPLLDRFQLPVLGRRRGWVLAFQLGLVGAIAAMSLLDPGRDAAAVVVVAIASAVLSASQDVVLDAYMTDV